MSTQNQDVPMTGTKAVVGAIITAVIGVATGLTELIPDPTVSLVCKVVVLVLGTAGAAFGVYQTPNTPKV